ncbi:hypothetical protein D7X55_08505 [Corallococcus sp. AB049A]|uniref:PLD phosphodiesterase domain-containing protein n=1 Tax=Corallococcus interemptor TaxID=2316720 RepID=A0A3A8QRK1_9BACT|nr:MULTISPECIES: phospholipase D-like domain-containing protein [Corallococcus]RKH69520.1 hypothetical protein D7X96_14595 [Corallococcus interemptor]RKI71968.1 hypothetical protein D7X55_08505 [Corallococcus sp. AB049A]
MSKRTSDHNSATFLMDGEEFFGTFAACLEEVMRSATEPVEVEPLSKGEGKKVADKPAPVPPTTYVRLAYWAMEKGLVLKKDDHHFTMEAALKQLADAGVHVEIILWDPDAVSANAGGDDNFAKKVARGNKAVHTALHGYKEKILVYLESHPKPGVGYGLHQKMSLFSIGGKLKALVGGFNMEEEYWDTGYHWGKHPIHGHNHTLHDTAVLVEGPVTCDIEEEWLRRWKRQSSLKLFGPTPPHVVRAGVRGLVASQPTDGGHRISVLTTGVSTLSTDHSIRDEIKTLIQGATTYLYAENYQFFDPDIVREVCRKLKAWKPFEVCVVIPDPVCDPTHANTQLSRIAYARMLLASFKEKDGVKGKLDDALQAIKLQGSTVPVPNDPAMYHKVVNKKSGKWMEEASLQVAPRPVEGVKVQARPVQVALEAIDSLDLAEGVTPRVQFYCPVRFPGHSGNYDDSTKIYVHSKLMLIDSKHVIVGSANFGYRSMEYDGEMSLHIQSDEFAVSVKQKLFPHYNVNSPKEVPAALRDGSYGEADRVKLIARSPGQLGMTSVHVKGYMKETMKSASVAMNYEWY